MREGGCACGGVRYRLTSEPLFVNCCHCLLCQRQSGTAFALNLVIEAERVEFVTGEPRPVAVEIDDGRIKTTYRCPACQVAIFGQSTNPDLRFVRAGTLDDASDVVPDAHIFTRSKLPWVVLDPSTPAFEASYDRDAVWPAASLERLAARDYESAPLDTTTPVSRRGGSDQKSSSHS
jgi:hypothetical protein